MAEWRSVWYFGGPWNWRNEHLPSRECRRERRVVQLEPMNPFEQANLLDLPPHRVAVYERKDVDAKSCVIYGFKGWEGEGDDGLRER